MNAKQDMPQRTAQQRMKQTQNPENESNNKERINNNRALTLEQTPASVTVGA